MLQCVAVCCSVWRWIVVGCSGLQWVAVGCSSLQWVAVGCSELIYVYTSYIHVRWPYLHRSFSAKELYIVAFLQRTTCNLRHPMSHRHPVLNALCDITPWGVWHDSLICMTWRIQAELCMVVMSHTWRRHVMSHIWHVTCMNEKCQTYEWFISHIWTGHVSQINESCLAYESVQHPCWVANDMTCSFETWVIRVTLRAISSASSNAFTYTNTHTHTHAHANGVVGNSALASICMHVYMCVCVCIHLREPTKYLVISHEWVMSQMNESCLLWTSHVAYEQVMSHTQKPMKQLLSSKFWRISSESKCVALCCSVL